MQRFMTLLLSLVSLGVQGQTLRYVGTAYLPDSRQPVYTESYTEHFNGDGKLTSGTVQYRQQNGDMLGEKHLDYRPHPYAPDFHFHNHKTGYHEAATWLADGRIRLQHREPGNVEQENTVQVSEPVVADAGFNQFMRDNLQKLKTGEPLDFNFLNPARLTWYRFTARMTAQDTQTISITIAPANTVLRWLVPSIDLVYSDPDGRLLHYRGLTNISFKGSKTISAHIDYHYTDSAPPALSLIDESLEYWLNTAEG